MPPICRGRAPIGLGTAALAVLLVAGSPVSGSAHAIVVESTPAPDAVLAEPPERVVLRFNSKIERGLSRVTLGAVGGPPGAVPIVAPDGTDQSPDRVVVSLHPLPPGRYVLRYKVLSADGHVTEGALRFTVVGDRR